MSKDTKEEELKRNGWTRMFTAKEPRLSESIELYESMGLEVRLEPLRLNELDEECKTCYEKDLDHYKTIYTKKKKKE